MLKTDDDTVVHIPRLLHHIEKRFRPAMNWTKAVFGYILTSSPVLHSGRWYVIFYIPFKGNATHVEIYTAATMLDIIAWRNYAKICPRKDPTALKPALSFGLAAVA